MKRGGYTTAVYIVSDGGTKEKVNEEKSFSESQFSGDNSAVKITDAGSVYLIAVSERTYDMGEYSDFEAQNNFDVVDSAVKKLEAVAEKYKSDAGFDYDTALQNHLKMLLSWNRCVAGKPRPGACVDNFWLRLMLHGSLSDDVRNHQ